MALFSCNLTFLISPYCYIFIDCHVTPECFGHMTWMLSSLAGGRIILSLEGGNDLEFISYSMIMCVKALLSDPLPPLKQNLCPSQHAVDSINQVIEVHSKYWPCLSFKVI